MQNENIIVRHFWNNLEAQLTLATSLREDNNTTKTFNRRVRNNEQVARKI